MSSRVPIEPLLPTNLAIDAPPDRPVLITVSGQAVDVRVAITGGEPAAAVFADAPNRRMGRETLFVDAPHAPVIRLQIEHNDHSGARGHADVVAVALPVATEADRQRFAAAKLDAAGCMAFPDAARADESVKAFDEAANLHGKYGDQLREGVARLHGAGARYVRLSDWVGSADMAALAATTLHDAKSPELAAFALRLEGAALDQRANAGDVEPARRERYLELARNRLTDAYNRLESLENPYEAGYALNYRGVSYDVAGDREQARADFQKALALFQLSGDEPAQALSLQSLALQSYKEGRLTDATREFDAALALIPRDEEPDNYAHTMHNSALPLRALGRFDEAIARFHEAGQILHARGDRDGEARALHGLAMALTYSGEHDRATELLEAAIHLRGTTGTRREQAVALMTLSELNRTAGKLDRAIGESQRALALVTAPHDIAQAKLFLARAYLAKDRLPEARRELEDILRLDLPATHNYLALALAELGSLESRARRDRISQDYFARAIAVLRRNGSELEHARVLVRRGAAMLRSGHTKGAIADTETAIRQLDDIGLQSLQAESRAAFRASYREAAELQIDAHLKQAESLPARGLETDVQRSFRRALAISDRSRARMIAESGTVPVEVLSQSELDGRNQHYELLAGKRLERDRLLNLATTDEDRVAELTREISRLRTEVSKADDRTAGKFSADGTRHEASQFRDPAALVTERTAVAEFFVGRTNAWLFEVRKDEVKVHRVGTAREVEKLARNVREEWRRHGSSSIDRTKTARTLASLLFRQFGLTDADDVLYVIPDGPLHLVPMTLLAQYALPDAKPQSVRLATTMVAARWRTPSDHGTDRLLAVIADPIYSIDDSRIRGSSPLQTPSEIPALTRAAQNFAQLKRLPSTRVEARMIASLTGNETATLMLTGSEATRHAIESAGLERYRIIHFATHALADSQDPGLATIALSRFDLDGHPIGSDLRAFDIARLRLNAELVVLSACDTAIGREIAGEAPLGLAHAFLRSGAKSVLATLWPVPDTSTARLMEEFYRQMLVNGRPPSAALELAQQQIREQPRWSDPYYWAGFQLISQAPFNAANDTVG